ncbi:hypothetical protein ALMP_39480 [Streptomyces sp. A012304]|nr:hypothetical protein ALMP_39480 [Streptomyces sp. A012304]
MEAAVRRAAEIAAADISFRLMAGEVRKGVPFVACSTGREQRSIRFVVEARG